MIRHELVRIMRKFFSIKGHTHGNITNDGKIGNTSGKIITTGNNGELQASATISKNQISDFPNSLEPANHTHVKNDITDFSHTHTKNQITDFSHTHTKNEITDFSHAHGDITSDGKITSNDTGNVKKAVVTDNNNNLKVISKIPFENLNITKANITGLGIPASDTNTDTTYSAGTGLTLNGTTFNIDEAPASEIKQNLSQAGLPNVAPGVTNAMSQEAINQLFDAHSHVSQWQSVEVEKGSLMVNTHLGLAEYKFKGTFSFTTANTNLLFTQTPVIPNNYAPIHRITQLIHDSTGGLTIGILYYDGTIKVRSYSTSTKTISIYFLYRYKKQGETSTDTLN